MRGCAAVLLSLIFLVPAGRSAAQCNWSPSYSGHFRSTYLDVAIDGNDLWTATGYGVQLFDRTSEPPERLADLPLPGVTRLVRPANGLLYAVSGTRIYAIRRTGKTLAIAGSVDAGATVNDLLVTALDLFAATSAGLYRFDLLNPTAPVRVDPALPTSGTNVTSLSLQGSTLYAADGDATVEVFSISIPSLPQKSGTVASLPRSISVQSTPSRLFVSDGFSTDVFVIAGSTTTKVINTSVASTSFAALTDGVAFVAGSDRRLHALDWTTPSSPVEVFAADVIPTGGTVNRIAAMALSANRLYVAAGDAGLLSYDVAAFGSPYPVRSYLNAPSSSTAWVDGKLYTARPSGGIAEFTTNSFGYLTPSRQWESQQEIVFGGTNGFLLSAAGSTLQYWTVLSTSPTLITSAAFPASIVDAVVDGARAIVVLSDHSVWTAELSQNPATTQQTTGLSGSSVAVSGNAVVLSDTLPDGSTALTWFPSPDLSTGAATANVAGVSTTPVALDGSTAAIFTFSGIVTHDFAAGTTSAIAGSSGAVARALAIAGARLFVLTDTALVVWDRSTGKVTRTLSLPASGSSMAVASTAAIASPSGVVIAAFDSDVPLPALASATNGNAYYRKVLTAPHRLFLFDGSRVDVFMTDEGVAPHHLSTIPPGGIVDVAANSTGVYTLNAFGTVAAWSIDGVPLRQTTISEGSGALQALSIAAAGKAVWASVATDCTSSLCQKKTIVFDSVTLTRSATLDGATVDVVTDGNLAYALFDSPSEIRIYDISDASHPAPVNGTAAPGSGVPGTRTPVSIAASDGTIYALGERLYGFPVNDIAHRTDLLTPFVDDTANGVTYVDQKIRIAGGCAVISGRDVSPQFYAVGQWSSGTPATVPAPVRSVAFDDTRLYLLTDDSLEIWTSAPATPLPRRRPTR